ncbi:protein phosphatase regulator [Exophiala dermatitidis]|nr:protein phosphatase regulator [Exophiala dermatitidis]KAJ4546522.1 protein phosphatase regulator [Exophiala dermatitidis]KAJ4578514.1 protein phosphatase regulator [Exophiala dermatitidis]KAJ4692460.1 protein phosphatase regulator, variant 2 [Exophiala dermatitidis]
MPVDTLDLQDHDAPSAKDHTRQPAHPSPYGFGPAAPHQAQTLRHAEEEAFQQQHVSPRASEDGPDGGYLPDQHFYDDLEDERDDDHITSQNGAIGNGYHGEDLDDGEGGDSQDEDLDDDLMDKISSSPSIEDGKYTLSPWPPRADSVDSEASLASISTPTRGIPSSSPFSSTPEHFPLRPSQPLSACHHGEYEEEQAYAGTNQHCGSNQDPGREHDRPPPLRHTGSPSQYYRIPLSESQEFTRYLLPLDDPVLAEATTACDDYHGDFGYEDDDGWEDDETYLQYSESSSDDDADDFHFCPDNRFIDSGWGGECLREVEDIDFEFVYALHTFVATVEGQANATKGDTMVLLDDSNSYWWLVRVVKDGSIGYLPAEHIETPTERLARLNKHRNVDLSASMLGDNPEKSKNPLKKAMRRRNAKTVQFAPPTYYEPGDYDFSDEDEEDEESQLEHTGLDTSDEGDIAEDQELAASAEQESQEQHQGVTVNGVQRTASKDSLRDESLTSPTKSQHPNTGPEQSQSEDSTQRSRKGVVRNTDSFFRDDTVETKKISLTPRLLRGDSDTADTTDGEIRQRPSLETFDKVVGIDDKAKEKDKDKDKKKEKKGMLSGLFKRKKGSVVEEGERVVEDARPAPQSKESMESLSNKSEVGPERKPSKLQKTPPPTSPKAAAATDSRVQQRDTATTTPATKAGIPPAPTEPAPAPPTTVRKVEAEPPLAEEQAGDERAESPTSTQVNRFPSLTEKRTIFSSITTALKPAPTTSTDAGFGVKPTYSKRAKERFAIDDSESDAEDVTPKAEDQERRSVSPVTNVQVLQPRSDSAMQVSPIEPSTPNKFGDYGHSAIQSTTLPSSPPPLDSNPTDSEGTVSTSKPSPSSATHTPSTSRSTPTWSDASLRTYMENDQDIKDLLIIVYDKSNVVPVGPEHPLMHNLFSDERTKLAEMQSQLDDMLLHWISKKNTKLLSATM